MKYLHKDYELFKEVINATASELGIRTAIVEKDYYVTMILKLLAQKAPGCVFKGGTSLSKCYHVIERFSEDIDIAFSEKLTQSQRKTLKDEIILGISKELELEISDWENAGSSKNYNCYTFSYEPIEVATENSMVEGVKTEVTILPISFPIQTMLVDNYVYRFLKTDNKDIIEEFGLEPFEMQIQSIERTLIDKVFAICDYYLLQESTGEIKTRRHSRHIYDIYKLLPKVTLDDKFKSLVPEIRHYRMTQPGCLSASSEVEINELLKEIIAKNVYREDYDKVTTFLLSDSIEYDTVISAIHQIINSGMFT